MPGRSLWVHPALKFICDFSSLTLLLDTLGRDDLRLMEGQLRARPHRLRAPGQA